MTATYEQPVPRVFRKSSNVEAVDKEYYFRMYYDVASAGEDAEVHYANFGWREGRNPSPGFHTLYYALKNLPSGRLSINPLLHYHSVGAARSGLETKPRSVAEWESLQKAFVSEYFDARFYTNNYADLLYGLPAIDHYFTYGWKNGCNPNAQFNTTDYLNRNEFIRASNVNPFFHALFCGDLKLDKAKGKTAAPSEQQIARADLLRLVAPYFDGDFYVSRYDDVMDAKINPLLHFVDHGWREGRDPSATFDTKYYLTRYGDEISPGVNPLLHFATVGEALGYRPAPGGSKPWPRPKAPSEADWAKVFAATGEGPVEVSVIIPVYRGYDDTLATIHSVLANRQRAGFRLVVINDRSPELELTTKLRDLSERELFVYLENQRNLGFIGTVNRGLALFPDDDVILLNSDTLVFGDWLDRMLAHAHKDPKAATITPFSNNATLCSYPECNKDNNMALECSLEELDAYAKVCNAGASIPIPTGVGFCFYIRRSVIEKIGGLDADFGRGYGEENDFCMRVIKAGYKNIFAMDVFVYHSGKVSFAEYFAGEFTQGQKLLIGKHPDYARRTASYLAANQGWNGRVRLDLYRLAKAMGRRSAVFVTMVGAGGVATHVNDLAARLEASGIAVVVAALGGDHMTLRPFDPEREYHTPSLNSIDMIYGGDLVEDFLEWLDPEIIHLHSVASASWRAASRTFSLLGQHGRKLFVTLHDYDPICYRHNLVDREGRYCAERTIEVCRACVAAGEGAVNRADPTERLADWRALLRSARQVFVPSEDMRRRLETIYSDIPFALRPHEDPMPAVAPLTRPNPREGIDIVAIGAIGPHKGLNILYTLALDARERNLPLRFHIVGYSAIPSELKTVGVSETGAYATLEQCVDEIRKIAPSYALLLSIWPETYFYSLSIALALGLPPVVFDLGAQAERVRAAGFGVVLETALAESPQSINDRLLALSLEAEWDKIKPVKFMTYDLFPSDFYDLAGETGRHENCMAGV